jgi:hypothetical protein
MVSDVPANLVQAFLAASLVTTAALPAQSVAAEKIRTLADLTQPQSRVTSIEVFHLDTSVETRAALGFGDLMKPGGISSSYVRISEDDRSISEFYASLGHSVIWETPCRTPDLRWAVVLTYRDRTQQAFGFGQFLTCVAIMSTGESVEVNRAMLCIGGAVAVSCHLGSWIVPMYFAGPPRAREHPRVRGRRRARAHARPRRFRGGAAGDGRERARARAFFLRTVAPHPWTPVLARLFGWGAPGSVGREAAAQVQDRAG